MLMGHPARKAGRSSSGGSTLGVKVGLLFIPLRASGVGRRPHPHRTGPTPIELAPPAWLAPSSGLWQLAPGIKPTEVFYFPESCPSPIAPASCLPPNPRHLDLHLLNPGDFNPKSGLPDPSI